LYLYINYININKSLFTELVQYTYTRTAAVKKNSECIDRTFSSMFRWPCN